MAESMAFLILAAIYLVPTIIAFARKHPKKVQILLLNLFLGWSGIGWIAALVWSLVKGKDPVEAHAAARAEASSRAATRDDPLVARGAGGTMTYNGREVLISRKGGLSLLIHGLAGEKAIPVSAIQAVQLRPARYGVRGYLQLSILGGIENRGGAIGAASDENSVLFDVADQAAFEVLAETLRDAIHQKSSPVMQSVSQADELAKLAGLRDQGVLTDDEFATMKARLIA